MGNITLDTKIFDLIHNNAGMKDILIDINADFKKLNKSIIGKTLTQEGADLKEAAVVVGMDPVELVNSLRKSLGQEIVETSDNKTNETSDEAPQWALNEPKYTLNANDLLKKDLSPLAEAQTTLRSLKKDDIFTIISDFRPQPLIDDLIKIGHDVYVGKINEEKFITYVKKNMNTAKNFKEAGVSPYLDGTQSPRRYFLIATQLPFFIESCVKHSETIGLDKETLAQIRELMAKTKPQVVDNATIVKRMELEVISKMVDEKYDAAEVDDLLVKIADQQLYMQRIHAKCINEVQEVLNDEQYAKLIKILKLGIEND